jgi:hypothetical protein
MTEIAPLQDFFANNQPIAELTDFFDQDFDEFGRPERTEDRLVRHRGDGRPKIWVPRDATLTAPGETIVLSTDMRLSNGMTLPAGTSVSFPGTEVPHPKAGKQVFYSRPSSWGDVTEDRTKISEWRQRMAVEGFARSKRLRLEWSALPGVDWDDSVRKAAARRLIDEAVLMAGADKDRQGTAVHAITERHDLGLEVHPPEEYEGDLSAWIDATQFFRIVNDHEVPGIECFVVADEVQCAGTFDRLIEYLPCEVCGLRKFVLDLKTGKIEWGKSSIAVQLAIYANSVYYIPLPGDIYPGLRVAMPDVCKHKAIVVHLPAGTGTATTHWIDIHRGWEAAKGIARDVREFRKERNWTVEFTPVPDLIPLIQQASGDKELNSIYAQHRHLWTEQHTALGHARLKELGA